MSIQPTKVFKIANLERNSVPARAISVIHSLRHLPWAVYGFAQANVTFAAVIYTSACRWALWHSNCLLAVFLAIPCC
jgi:hypothetical protein